MPPTHAPDSVPYATFSLGPDAALVGDDAHGGLLAASLRYVCRLAKAMGDVLDLGELSHVETTGSTVVIAEIGWDLAGDCRLRGQMLRSTVVSSAPGEPAAPGARFAGATGVKARESRSARRLRRPLVPLTVRR